MNALMGLMNPASVGQSVMEGYEAGRKRRREEQGQNALLRYTQDPSEANALGLMAYQPEMGLKLQQHARDRQFGDAAARYYLPQNALAPVMNPDRPGQPVARDGSPAPLQVGASMSAPPPTPADPATAPGPATAAQQPPANPDFRVLGQPQTQADAAFLDMLRIDPKRAMSIDSEMRDRVADRLKLQRDAYGFAISRLAGATDEDSYQAALDDIARNIEPLGVEVTDHLPAKFPGTGGLRDLRLGALDAKDQLNYFLRESDIEADNERADRNTDSLITDREARRAETRRYHDRADTTRRRGQDIGATTTRRGQDMRGSGRGGGRANIPTVRSPEDVKKLPSGTQFRTPDGRIKIAP